MFRCVLTGGPCAGKTTILKTLTKVLTEKGYYVFCCPEAATDLIMNGIEITKELPLEEFQNFVLNKQLANEKLYEDLQNYYPSEKIIIFYDRGLMDQRAYMDNDDKFEELIASRFLNKYSALMRYDAVFHLVTAADGALKYYQWNDPNSENPCNNEARKESPEQAIESDRRVLNCWTGHPKLRIFDNSTDFEGKINRVLNELMLMIGAPIPKSIQRKYLIKMPEQKDMKNLHCNKTPMSIVQTYLHDKDSNTERRIRQMGSKEKGYAFYYTEKRAINETEREEVERKINKEQYIDMMTEAETGLHQIIKTRYSFVVNNKQFTIDQYQFDKNMALMEVNLTNADENIGLPQGITVLKEVTQCPFYKNRVLAERMTLKE